MMPARVWCWTPNPVLETKFSEGRRIVSAGGKGHNVARQLCQWGLPVVSVVSKVGKEWLQVARNDGLPIREIPIRSIARTCAVVSLDVGKNPLVLNDTLGYGSTTASTVVIVDDKIA